MEFKIIASLIKQKNFSAAKVGLLELISKKINLENDFKNIYFTLSQVCIQLNQLNESKKYLAKHLEINPKDCEALLYLATLQLKTRDIENTEKIYKKILSIDKNYLPAIVNLAIFYEGTGKIDRAIKYYEAARELEPNNLNFYYNLIRINSDYLSDKRINFIKELIKNETLTEKDKYLANLILSQNYEKKKDYKNEIKFLKLSQDDFLKYNADKRSHEYWLDIIPYYYRRFTYKENNKNFIKKIKPIFIVGLPRSGSTITEMILSTSKTHKNVLGESSLFNFSFINLYNEKLFQKPKKSEIEIDIDLITEKILSNLKNYNISNSEESIFIDKSLENFFYIDLIIKIFPNAKFVITERNIIDNIIGIYKKILLDIPWAHNISEIIQFVDNYKIIINFYKKKYKKNIKIIKLDDLQNFNKIEVEDLFNFCGLEFNNKYFEFQKKNLYVENASNIQIRNEAFKFQSNKYKKYYHLLKGYEKKYSWIQI